MTTFDHREKAFETKYKHDEELRFKATARRNKLVGLWAAAKMGITGEQAEAYARDVVQADFEEPGDDEVLRKLVKDFEAAGVKLGKGDVRFEMDQLLHVAMEQIRASK